VEEIYAAKEARRKYLAKLPIDQKIDLIEQLHEFGKTMIEARKSLPKQGASETLVRCAAGGKGQRPEGGQPGSERV